MIKAETNPDKSISVSCMGSPMQLIREAAAVLANVAEAVGDHVMSTENMSRMEAETQAMANVIALAARRCEQQRSKKN